MVDKFRKERGWDGKNPFVSVAYIMEELGELAREVLFRHTNRGQYKREDQVIGSMEEEIADVFYWVLVLSSDLDIDLEKALLKKMEKNEKVNYPLK